MMYNGKHWYQSQLGVAAGIALIIVAFHMDRVINLFVNCSK